MQIYLKNAQQNQWNLCLKLKLHISILIAEMLRFNVGENLALFRYNRNGSVRLVIKNNLDFCLNKLGQIPLRFVVCNKLVGYPIWSLVCKRRVGCGLWEWSDNPSDWEKWPCEKPSQSTMQSLWKMRYSFISCVGQQEVMARTSGSFWWLSITLISYNESFSSTVVLWKHITKQAWLEESWNPVNTLRLRQNGRSCTDDIFRCIFLNETHEFRPRFHSSLFLSFELTIFQHWSR